MLAMHVKYMKINIFKMDVRILGHHYRITIHLKPFHGIEKKSAFSFQAKKKIINTCKENTGFKHIIPSVIPLIFSSVITSVMPYVILSFINICHSVLHPACHSTSHSVCYSERHYVCHPVCHSVYQLIFRCFISFSCCLSLRLLFCLSFRQSVNLLLCLSFYFCLSFVPHPACHSVCYSGCYPSVIPSVYPWTFWLLHIMVSTCTMMVLSYFTGDWNNRLQITNINHIIYLQFWNI